MANVLLGVTGSVACYRAADLARELMRSNHLVRVLLTRSAAQFVQPALFEALTGQPCLVDAFEEPVRGGMAHIEWARWADVFVVAPATANSLAALHSGFGQDMLTTAALAFDGPIVLAPAMNPTMYAQEPVRQALKSLEERGALVVEPVSGDVACGENGQGKLAQISEIVAAVEDTLDASRLLVGQRVLITSGPTEEPLDDVRHLTNRSSGQMGSSLAKAALMMGAQVTVVAGPQAWPLPLKADVVRVQTAQQMLEACLQAQGPWDWIFGVAAVADYRPEPRWPGKKRRSDADETLRLVANPDIIATLASQNSESRVVAFAAEPSTDLEAAHAKRFRKGVYAVAANDVSRSDIGFDSGQNELALITAMAEYHSGLRSKFGCAVWLLRTLIGEFASSKS